MAWYDRAYDMASEIPTKKPSPPPGPPKQKTLQDLIKERQKTSIKGTKSSFSNEDLPKGGAGGDTEEVVRDAQGKDTGFVRVGGKVVPKKKQQ